MLNLLSSLVILKLVRQGSNIQTVNSHTSSVIFPPQRMFFQVRVINSVIQSNGEKHNVEKRGQSGVLTCNVLGTVTVP